MNSCTSCQLCAAVCARDAIHIELDKEGYYRPFLDAARCVDCGLCAKVCYKFDGNVKVSLEEDLKSKPLYAAWAKDEELVRATTSGGISDLLAHQLLAEGYKVVGCAYNDEEGRAEHRVADSKEELLHFRGSKYIQSYTFAALKTVVEKCRNEKFAVFGTPCQIYALSRLAEQRRVRENFFFVDLYCHGCPSLHVWTKYQNYIKSKLGIDHFNHVDFRSKVRGWGLFNVAVIVDGKIVFKSNPKEDGFYELFFSDLVLNEGCHECKLRGSLEYTDIRLGDFWGKKYLNNRKGVSAVSLSTERAKEVFAKIESQIESAENDYADFLPFQSWGKCHTPNVKARAEILASLCNPDEPISNAVDALHRNQSLKLRIKRCTKNVLYYLPPSATACLKRFL